MTTQAILNDLYDLLTKEGTGARDIKCVKCGKIENGFVPMVYVPPDDPLPLRIIKEEYNRCQKEALAKGNVMCWECAEKEFTPPPQN